MNVHERFSTQAASDLRSQILGAPPCARDLTGLPALVQLLDGIREEQQRAAECLHLTAYENRLSKLAHSFLSSNLSFRQHEGTLDEHDGGEGIRHGRFVFRGLGAVYALERAAREAAQELFHAALCDFRPVSGLHGMMCTIAAATDPGDLVYTIDPLYGGHCASRHMLNRLGRQSEYIPWSNEDLTVDLDAFADSFKRRPPRAVFFEHGTPLFSLPLRGIREIVGDEVTLIYDASHTLGLIAGKLFQNPLDEGCDILQGNLHKTFPGPQKALISFKRRETGLSIAASISNGLVSSQHTHHALAAYITTLEMQAFAEEYAWQTVSNARALASALAAYGFDVVSRNGEHTRSHQILIRGNGVDEGCHRLFACGISTNARDAFGGRVMRIGVQEVTRRGMKIGEMDIIARLLRDALINKRAVDAVKGEVKELNSLFNNVHYSFDEELGLNRA